MKKLGRLTDHELHRSARSFIRVNPCDPWLPHFAKGNPAGKESIDRISGSGVFARDPDSLVTFTRHEEDGAFVVESTLRNFPPVDSFVVSWDYPLFKRADQLDPTKLRQSGGRPVQYTEATLLKCLGNEPRTTSEWQTLCRDEEGVPRSRFYSLLGLVEKAGTAEKSVWTGDGEKTS